jgi:hypothetical protein
MRVWFWTRVEKPSHVDAFFSDVLKNPDDVLLLPISWGKFRRSTYLQIRHNVLLVGTRHIPGMVYHLLVIRQELIQVIHTSGVFREKFGFTWNWFARLVDSSARLINKSDISTLTLIKFKMITGTPYLSKRLSKCRAAAV